MVYYTHSMCMLYFPENREFVFLSIYSSVNVIPDLHSWPKNRQHYVDSSLIAMNLVIKSQQS